MLIKIKRVRKSGIKYKKCIRKKKKIETELKKLCRNNYRINNQSLIEKLEISKTEFYRNYKILADQYRKENQKEALF